MVQPCDILLYTVNRFGKVTWSKFPEEIYHKKYSIQDLAEILFEKDIKHLNIFNTE